MNVKVFLKFICRILIWPFSLLGRGSCLPVSSGYRILSSADEWRPASEKAWNTPEVAKRQHRAYQALVRQARLGAPRVDLAAAAQALSFTGEINPRLLEVGCGSGYYSEIFKILFKKPIQYYGVDNSEAMISLARRRYPGLFFQIADATHLPFKDGEFNVVFNCASLMHILNYASAISESRRLSCGWCIFQTVTVLQNKPTTFLEKKAYGFRTFEIVFNEEELYRQFERNRLKVEHVLPSIPYDLIDLLGEPTKSNTYVCRVLK